MLSVFVLLITLLLALHIYLRCKPAYSAAKKIPGFPIYPIIGNVLEVLNVSSAAKAFNHATLMAKTFGRGYRFYLFGTLHYWPLKAIEMEVSCDASMMITPPYMLIHQFHFLTH